MKSRLGKIYKKEVVPGLLKSLKLKNIMAVPAISKIVLNVGVKEAVSDSRALRVVSGVLMDITGQRPVSTVAKRSIAGFKIREGMTIGLMVTLRGVKMYDFFDKFINLALPKVRDFRGLSAKFDGRGNYNVGVKDCTIFPEADVVSADRFAIFGINVTICTTSSSDEHAFELLKSFGVPFGTKL